MDYKRDSVDYRREDIVIDLRIKGDKYKELYDPNIEIFYVNPDYANDAEICIKYTFVATYIGRIIKNLEACAKMLEHATQAKISNTNDGKCLFADVIRKIERLECLINTRKTGTPAGSVWQRLAQWLGMKVSSQR